MPYSKKHLGDIIIAADGHNITTAADGHNITTAADGHNITTSDDLVNYIGQHKSAGDNITLSVYIEMDIIHEIQDALEDGDVAMLWPADMKIAFNWL